MSNEPSTLEISLVVVVLIISIIPSVYLQMNPYLYYDPTSENPNHMAPIGIVEEWATKNPDGSLTFHSYSTNIEWALPFMATLLVLFIIGYIKGWFKDEDINERRLPK